MGIDEFDPKAGQLMAYQFTVANAVTAQTNVDLVNGQAGITLVTMPKAGSVVGLCAAASAAVTTDKCTFRAHKAGTEFAQSGYPAPILSSTTYDLKTWVTCNRGNLTFVAGDTLGVSYTSTTDMAPTSTNDYNVTLYVMFDRD
jgi:hypothetical protein